LSSPKTPKAPGPVPAKDRVRTGVEVRAQGDDLRT